MFARTAVVVFAISGCGGGSTATPDASIDGATVDVLPVDAAPDVSRSTLVVDPMSARADGISEIAVTVTARDAADQVVAGVPVTFQVSGTKNLLARPTSITDAQGRATARLSSVVAGPRVITATVAGGPTLTANVELTAVPCVMRLPGAPMRVTGARANAMSTFDANGDGALDLVVGEDHHVAVFRGLGNGTFASPTRYLIGNDARVDAVAHADLDGDGNADLVVATRFSRELIVLRGDGTGAFAVGAPIEQADGPLDVALADLDADGKQDLVLRTEHAIHVMRGNGDATFAPPVTHALASMLSLFTGTVVLVDINGDGLLDVVTAGSDSQLDVLLGASAAQFGAPIRIAATYDGGRLSIADLDGDAKLDIVTTSTSSAQMLKGNGNGTFTYGPALLNEARGSSLIDVDGDGKLDLLALTGQVTGMRVHRGNGTFAFTRGPQYMISDVPRSHATGDFDGDGRQDVAIGGDRSLRVLLGSASGTFFGAELRGELGGWYSAVTGDFDTSGTLDFVSSPHGDFDVRVQLAAADGTLTSVPGISGVGRDAVVVDDFDADGKLDVITTQGGFGFLRGNGNGSLQPAVITPTGHALSWRAVAAHLDGDTHLDLVGIHQSRNEVVVARGTGTGAFTVGSVIANGVMPDVVRAADVDGDGDRDLVVGARGGTQVRLYRNNGDATFQPGVSLANTGPAYDLALADLDGDGTLDLIRWFGSPTVVVARGAGDGTFVSPTNWTLPTASYGGVVVDVDADGHLDVVAVGQGISVLRGQGNLTFHPASVHDNGYDGLPVVADFDGDGRVDLFMNRSQEPGFRLLRNATCE